MGAEHIKCKTLLELKYLIYLENFGYFILHFFIAAISLMGCQFYDVMFPILITSADVISIRCNKQKVPYVHDKPRVFVLGKEIRSQLCNMLSSWIWCKPKFLL